MLAWRAAMRWVRSDVAGCEELIEPAEAAATASGDDAALAAVHTTRAMIAAFQADRRANEWSYRKALEHAERAGDVIQMVRIHTNMGSHFSEEGSYPEAIAELDTAISLAELAGIGHRSPGTPTPTAGTPSPGWAVSTMRCATCARRSGSGSGWNPTTSPTPSPTSATSSTCADSSPRPGRCSPRAIELAEQGGDVQGLVPGAGRPGPGADRRRPACGRAAAAERAISIGQPLWRSQAHSAAGWIDLHRGDRAAAHRHAELALEHAHTQLDRPAVAEALLLLAASQEPPAVSRAEEAGRLWHELGNPIGEARALLLVAETLSGGARAELVATAERLLYDAGAWRYLADVRRLAAEPATAPPPVAITTLGGFRVTRGGVPVEVGDWGSRKARDLLKLLVARRGAPVVRDEVTEMLWPDETDRSARRLSVLLSTIRSVLDPAKRWPPDYFVAADHDAVWLVREHVDVDVELFLTEAAEGRRLLTAGNRTKGADGAGPGGGAVPR